MGVSVITVMDPPVLTFVPMGAICPYGMTLLVCLTHRFLARFLPVVPADNEMDAPASNNLQGIEVGVLVVAAALADESSLSRTIIRMSVSACETRLR